MDIATLPTANALPANIRGAIMAMGNFDGVHQGHRALFAHARVRADKLGVAAGALTFDPHPTRVVRPDAAPQLLMTLEERLACMADCGLDVALVLRFDQTLAATDATSFARDSLRSTLGIGAVVVGEAFRFGKGGRGGATELRTGLGGDDRVDVVPSVRVGALVVSSTSIRQALAAGDVQAASLLLGRPYELGGPVVRGDARGRTIGFPTANIHSGRECVPAFGVYPVRATVDGVTHDGVCNLGMRPTVGGTERRIEVHLLDHNADLYGKHMSIRFLNRLRPEQKFDGVSALQAQIARDAEGARAALRKAFV
jgi:riboflavin kinase / FMN adenylyltransferase